MLAGGVLPAPHQEGRGVGARVGEDRQAGGGLPAVLDEVARRRPPTRPRAAPRRATRLLPRQRPDVDVAPLDARVGGLHRVGHLGARGPVVEQDGGALGRLGHLARHRQAAHVRLVGLGDPQRRVEEVEDRHGAGLLALGEARGVLQGVDGGAPQGDAAVLQPAVELLEGVPLLVEEAAHPAVHGAGHLGAGVDAAEAEQRVGAHLRRLAGLGHEPLAEGDHDGVVLRQRAGQVPEPLAHDVGADGVGGLLDLVVAVLVLARPLAEAAEELGAERGGGRRHGQAAGDAARREAVGGDRIALGPLDLHVLEPEVEAEEDGPGVEGPLGDHVALLVVGHGLTPGPRAGKAVGGDFSFYGEAGRVERIWRPPGPGTGAPGRRRAGPPAAGAEAYTVGPGWRPSSSRSARPSRRTARRSPGWSSRSSSSWRSSGPGTSSRRCAAAGDGGPASRPWRRPRPLPGRRPLGHRAGPPGRRAAPPPPHPPRPLRAGDRTGAPAEPPSRRRRGSGGFGRPSASTGSPPTPRSSRPGSSSPASPSSVLDRPGASRRGGRGAPSPSTSREPPAAPLGAAAHPGARPRPRRALPARLPPRLRPPRPGRRLAGHLPPRRGAAAGAAAGVGPGADRRDRGAPPPRRVGGAAAALRATWPPGWWT